MMAAVNGPLRLTTDMPVAGQTVTVPFAVGGWALDQLASSGTGIDAVHVYAFPIIGPPIFLGPATMGIARPDVGEPLQDPVAERRNGVQPSSHGRDDQPHRQP